MTQNIDISSFAISANVDDSNFKEAVYNKRIELIRIALRWEATTPENNMIFHNVWKYPVDPSYVVCFGKYGKEYYQLNTQNPQDFFMSSKSVAVVESFG